MKLPPGKTFEDLRWLLDEDLNDFRQCGKANLVDLAEPYLNDEPWRSIAFPNYRRQAILISLQSELRGELLKRNAEEVKQLRAQIETRQKEAQRLKAALEAQIIQGATLGDYAACWVAFTYGDEAKMQKAVAEVERKRAEWRAECERQAIAAKRERLKRSAEELRNRAPGYTVPVNWFASMPVYRHMASNISVQWGYCQATGQDRWKVKDFLRKKNQKPIDQFRRKGAGKPLDLYGFKTNLLVLDKWLGDWLLGSPGDEWKYQDTNKPGETFWFEKAERVCETIYTTLCHASGYEHTKEQAEQFRALLRKHWQKWWSKVKDQEVRAELDRIGVEKILAPNAKAWRIFSAKRRAKWMEITAKVEAENRPVNGQKPYAEVWNAYERLRKLLG